MVASNPLFRRWSLKKFSATVIDDIWPEVIFFTMIAVMVVLVSEKTSANLGVSNQLLTVLGLVLGLVISFRTSSAYERYQDGRKMWTNITVASKNLAQMIWIHVPDERSILPGQEKEMSQLECVIEKKTMINLVQAYAVSIKHLLRGEQGVYYEDLYPLVSFLPRYVNGSDGTEAEKLPLWLVPEVNPNLSPLQREENRQHRPIHDREKTMVDTNSGSSIHQNTVKYKPTRRMDTFDPEALLPQLESEHPLKPARNPPETTVYDYIPVLRIFPWVFRFITCKPRTRIGKKKKAYSEMVESHIPLEIFLVLSHYSGWLMRNNLIQPAIASGITANLTLLQDTVSNLERICNTPLPFAYQAHLRMSLWIYLALLPFQIYTSYGPITIPATAFASFLLLGFLEIGQEIENPFNYDLNDLDLDYFCLSIQRELHEITAHVNTDPMAYIFTKMNQPLAPSDRRHAEELLNTHGDGDYQMVHEKGASNVTPGVGSLRRTLVTGWKIVDDVTRNR